MALQAKIVVPLDQHLVIDRAVRTVAHRAAFPERFVLEDERLGLFAMTLGARFVEARHRQPAGGFQHVMSVRIVALRAIHLPFDYRMMLGQVELRVGLQMTLKTRRRVLAGVDDKFAATASGFDVLAARAVAGFATVIALAGRAVKTQPRMRIGGKAARVIRVTFEAGLIAGERGAGDGGRRERRAFERGAGNENERPRQQAQQDTAGVAGMFHETAIFF